ncbi:MAG: DUF2490 domain-containing protein [Deltaproteobacteria bacterium]|nr:DUF2490 domain-containing protein [Deltaproteobacteria bacterium]
MRSVAATTLCALVAIGAVDTARADEGQLWSEVGLRYKVNKKVRLEANQYLRFTTSPLETEQVMPEVSGTHEPIDGLRLRLGYRYISSRNKFDRFEKWHRFFGDVRVQWKWKKVRMTNRLRYQNQVTDEFGEQNNQTLRDQLQLGYDTDRMVEPFVSGELFYRMTGKRAPGIDKYRFEMGASAEIDRHDVSLSYRMELPVADANDPMMHILSFSYHFTL